MDTWTKRLRIGGAALAGALALCGCAAVIDQATFFPASAEAPAGAALVAPPGYTAEDAMLELPGLGRLHAVRLDKPGTDTTVIYSGGNHQFVSGSSPHARALAEATGADIILYDYPGRGGTDVPATIDAAIATGPALMAALRGRGWIGRGPLYAYGLSFGGSQAAAMARNGGFDGLILEGTAADIARVGRGFVPWFARPFVRLSVDPELSRFDYLGYAAAAGAPVLLLATKDDGVVTPATMRAFSRDLAGRGAAVQFREVPGEHGEALRYAEGRRALSDWLRALAARPAS